MDDQRIVALYWDRDEAAIAESDKKYGKYCRYIADAILHSDPDTEECVNDTWLGAWQSMPPHRPQRLGVYLGKITRNLAIGRYARDHAQKRSAPTALVLDEVEEFLPAADESLPLSEELALKEAINRFVGALPRQSRVIFVRRYFYLSPIKEIAESLGLSESNVKVILLRTRSKFRAHLEKEGIVI